MSSKDKTKLSAPEMILEKNPVIEWFGKIILIIKTTIKKKKICSIYITSFYKCLRQVADGDLFRLLKPSSGKL